MFFLQTSWSQTNSKSTEKRLETKYKLVSVTIVLIQWHTVKKT